MIINIRGTNGSGKSTIAVQLLQKGKASPLYGALGCSIPEAHCVHIPDLQRRIYVLGPYFIGQQRILNGGCDRLRKPKTILELVLKYERLGHVVFEGLILGDYYGELMKSIEPWGKDVIVAFLSTPFEVCRERTLARSLGSVLKKTDKADMSWVKRYVGEHADGSILSFHFANVARVKKNMLKEDIFRVEDISSGDGHLQIMRGLIDGESDGH